MFTKEILSRKKWLKCLSVCTRMLLSSSSSLWISKDSAKATGPNLKKNFILSRMPKKLYGEILCKKKITRYHPPSRICCDCFRWRRVKTSLHSRSALTRDLGIIADRPPFNYPVCSIRARSRISSVGRYRPLSITTLHLTFAPALANYWPFTLLGLLLL